MEKTGCDMLTPWEEWRNPVHDGELAWWAMARRAMKAIRIYRIAGNKLEYTGRVLEIGGPATMHTDKLGIEVVCSMPNSVEALYAIVKATEKKVAELYPGIKLCPSHSGWLKLVGKQCRIDLLFARTGEEPTATSRHFAARCSLDYHLGSLSRRIGRARVHVIRGEHEVSLHDGVQYARASWYGRPLLRKDNPLKIAGYLDVDRQVFEMTPLLKGLLVVVPDEQWTFGDCDIAVPEISLKFDNGENGFDMDVYAVFRNIASDHVSISVQMLERVPLTEYGKLLFHSELKDSIRRIMNAYRDPSGMQIAKFFKLALDSKDECSDSDEDDLLHERMETASAVQTLLASGMPMATTEYLNETLPIVVKAFVKKTRMRGLTAFAVPVNCEAGEVYLSRFQMRRMGLQLGDRVTVFRYPNTGIETAECIIVGYLDVNGIGLAPSFWASRFSGDFDGDLAGVLPMVGLIEEREIVGVSPKNKVKKEMTISEAVSRGLYAKYLIPSADALVTLAVEQGKDLAYPRQILQATVDSIKHAVAFPSIAKAYQEITGETLKGSVFSKLSPSSALVRGRFGSKKRARFERYTKLMSLAQWGPFGEVVSEFKEMTVGVDRLSFPAWDGAARFARVTSHASDMAIQIAERYKKWTDSFKLGVPTAVEETYEELRGLRAQVVDHPHGGDALLFLFVAIAYGQDKRIHLKALRIFGYMPTKLGRYDLLKLVRTTGYRRQFALTVE